MLSGWCGVVKIKALGGSWVELELEAMNDSVAKTVVKRSTSEQDGTRLANTYRSTVTAFAAGC